MRHLALMLLTVFIADLGGLSINHPGMAEASVAHTGGQDRSTLIAVAPESEARREQITTPDPRPLLDGVPAPQLRGTLAMQTYSLDFYRLPGGMHAETIQAFA